MAAAALPPFIQQFEMAINNLGAITEANVKNNIARRTQFTTNVLAGLTDINTQVQSLIRRLTRFRQRYEQLLNNQGRYDAQINALTQRAEELEKQINELAAKNGSSSAASQQQLAQCQAQRAQLQTAVDALQKNNAQLTQELQDLRQQIAKLIGQQPAQDQDLMRQLEQQIQKLNDQIRDNNNRIAELEGLNQQLQQKIKISQAASSVAQEANQKIIDGHQGNIDALERQIAELTAARDDLQTRIERATPILQEIYGYINDLINAPPRQGQVTQFNETLDEIKKNLQELNNLIPPQFNADPLGPPGSPGSSGSSGSSGASGLSGALGGLLGSSSSGSSGGPGSLGASGLSGALGGLLGSSSSGSSGGPGSSGASGLSGDLGGLLGSSSGASLSLIPPSPSTVSSLGTPISLESSENLNETGIPLQDMSRSRAARGVDPNDLPLSSDRLLNPNPEINISGQSVPLNGLIAALQSNQPRFGSNYASQLLKGIQDRRNIDPNFNDPQNVAFINNTLYNNNKVLQQGQNGKWNIVNRRGGKRTKRNRKQKGGYTYKDNKAGYIIIHKTKKNRRKTTNTSTRKTTRNSNRRSTRNSIYY